MAYKNSFLLILIYCVLFLAPFIAHAADGKKKSFTACYNTTAWPPNILGEGEIISSPPGLFIDYITHAAELHNLDLEMVRRPWKRCLAMIRSNLAQSILGGSYTPERGEYAAYPMDEEGKPDSQYEIGNSNYYLYVHRDNKNLTWDGTSLTGIRHAIGIDLGYSVGKKLRRDNIPIQEYSDTKMGFYILEKNHIDGYITFENLGEDVLRKFNYNIVRIEKPYLAKSYFLMISKKFADENGDLTQQIWSSIKHLRENMPLDLRQKYSLN